jgi:hypothetical protein
MIDRIRVMFGGFDWTNSDDRARAFRSTIATDAIGRAFGEWYFTFKRAEPHRALSIMADAYIEMLDVRGESDAERFMDLADPREIN